MNKNMEDYQKYSSQYSSIEIEIIPNNKYGKFINIKEKDEQYFHIYFNNNKEEIKRDHINENDKVKTIRIIVDYQIKYLDKLFYRCECINSIYFKKFYRNNIKSMYEMFSNCTS